MKKIFAGILFIFLLSLILRFWNLSSYPRSLSMDEVGFGYNGYSILKTGRDEFGLKFPLVFKNLGDYKLPVDVYLTTISIASFGVNEFAIRFPVALIGSLTPILFIFLIRELKFSWKASFLTGLWMSLLGWHIFLSRASFEAITALFFVILGTLLFILWTKKNKSHYLAISVLSFSLSVWTYNAERLFVPIFFVLLLIIFKGSFKEIFQKPRKYILSLIIILVFIVPLIYLLISGNSVTSRARDLWIGRDHTSWTGQYLNYFDPVFWFWKGVKITPPDYPDVGLIYLADIPVFLLGIYFLAKSKNKILKSIVFAWFFLGPIPASFTRGDASPVRFLVSLPFFGFVMASGFEEILSLSKKRLIISIYLFLLLVNLIFFLSLYFNGFTKFYADLWHFGYKEATIYACQNHNKYNKIILTDKYGIEWPSIKTVPYLYILIYCEFDPADYLKDKNLFNIEIRQPQWRIDSQQKNYLLIGSRWDFPEDFDKSRIMKEVDFPISEKAAFYFVETYK